MRKILIGVEVVNILVGEVDFLIYFMVVLVCFLYFYVMFDLIEVLVFIKFVFIMFGFMGNQSKYYEIGRVIVIFFFDEVNKFLVYLCMNLYVCFLGIMYYVFKLFNCFILYF